MGPPQKFVELSGFVLSLGIQSHTLKKYFSDFLHFSSGSITFNCQLQKLKPSLSKPLKDKACLKADGYWLGALKRSF
jgi:hypothetical protein